MNLSMPGYPGFVLVRLVTESTSPLSCHGVFCQGTSNQHVQLYKILQDEKHLFSRAVIITGQDFLSIHFPPSLVEVNQPIIQILLITLSMLSCHMLSKSFPCFRWLITEWTNISARKMCFYMMPYDGFVFA